MHEKIPISATIPINPNKPHPKVSLKVFPAALSEVVSGMMTVGVDPVTLVILLPVNPIWLFILSNVIM